MFDSERDQEDLTLEGLLGLSPDAPSGGDGTRPPAEAPQAAFSLEEALGLGGAPGGGEGADGQPARPEAGRPGAAADGVDGVDGGEDLLSRLIFGSAVEDAVPARAEPASAAPDRAGRAASAATPAATLASLFGVSEDGRPGREEASSDGADGESPFDLLRAFGVEDDGGRKRQEAERTRKREAQPSAQFDLSSALGIGPAAPTSGGFGSRAGASPSASSDRPSGRSIRSRFADLPSSGSPRPAGGRAGQPSAQPAKGAGEPAANRAGAAAGPVAPAAGRSAARQEHARENAAFMRLPAGGESPEGAADRTAAEAGKGVGGPAAAGATAPVPPAISVPRHHPMMDFSKLLPAKASPASAKASPPAVSDAEPDTATRATGSSRPGKDAAKIDAAGDSATASCDGGLREVAGEGREAPPAVPASRKAERAAVGSRPAAAQAASFEPAAPPSAPDLPASDAPAPDVPAPDGAPGAPRRGLMLVGTALLAGAALVGALAIGVAVEGAGALQREGSPLSLWEEAMGGKLHPSTVEYRYTVKAADGTLGEARETASFDADGMLEKSRITVTLADGAQAERFLEEARAAFGDSLADGRTSGAEASFTVVAQGEPVDSDTYTELLRRDTVGCEVVARR